MELSRLHARRCVGGRTAVLALAGAATLALPHAARAEPPAPFQSRTDAAGHPALDSWLEDHLQQMMTSCVGGALYKGKIYMEKRGFGSSKIQVSAVPDFVRTNLIGSKPGQYLLPKSGMSLTREFGYIYSAAEMGAKADPGPGPASGFLDGIDYSNISDLVVAPGINATTYTTDCTDVLSSDVDISGGFVFPAGALKGGLDANYANSLSYALNIVAGRFQSPLIDTLLNNVGTARPDPRARSILALELWDWYATNPSRVTGPNYLLYYFDGIALYKQAGLKKKVTFDANGSASAGVPGIVTVSTKDSLALGQTTTSSVQAFETATFLNGNVPSRGYYPLPSPAELATVVQGNASAALDSSKSGDLTIVSFPSPAIPFYISVYGIPDKDCLPSTWTPSDPRVTLQTADASIDGRNIHYCTFSAQYSPTAADYQSGSSIAGTLDSQPMPGMPGAVARIRLKPIAFAPTSNPQVQYPSGAGPAPFAPPAGSGPSTLTWSLALRLIYDAARPVNNPAWIDLSGAYVDCSNATYYPTPGTATLSAPTGNNVATLSFSLSYQYAGSAADLAKPGATKTCTLKGPIIYNLPTTKITRALPNIPITFPAA